MNIMTRAAAAILLAATACGLGGCLISSHNSTTISGSYVSPATYDEVKPGETTAEWVKAAFGEPSCKTPLASGEELWKWTYSKTKEGTGTVLFIFGGSDKTETVGHVNIQVRDGVVIHKWRD
jgi:outer membrane protein assembly factor BamE (lipoprotein component of BamABCDE complex)